MRGIVGNGEELCDFGGVELEGENSEMKIKEIMSQIRGINWNWSKSYKGELVMWNQRQSHFGQGGVEGLSSGQKSADLE